MNWEALSAVSTAFTAGVMLLTVIYAARQVGAANEQSRALTAQLEHLRRATQLDGTLAVFDELFSPDFLAAYRFVLTDYDELRTDARFYAEALERAPDTEKHKERQVLRHMERIGTLVRNELLDAEVMIDFAEDMVRQTWRKLKPLALEQRQILGDPHMWENFEFLADEVERLDVAGRRSKRPR
jgi:hypothetical protein